MKDKRTRIECINDGSWGSLTDKEKQSGLLEFSEGDYDSKDFGSLETFICHYHAERLKRVGIHLDEAKV